MLFKIGCQTYTWEMLGDTWKGSLDEVIDIISNIGFEGIEISNNMIGRYLENPGDLKKLLLEKNLQFSAFAYSSPYGFSNPDCWEIEMEGIRKAIEFLAFFPGTILSLAGATSIKEINKKEGLANACKFYNDVGKLCKSRGITLTVHPHSHHGSLIMSREDYEEFMNLTDPQLVKWNPDTGHIIRSGQDLVDCLNRYKMRIAHIHLKDVDKDGNWCPLGKGKCDILATIEVLKEINYSGWVILEEESDLAREKAEEVIREDFKTLKSLTMPYSI